MTKMNKPVLGYVNFLHTSMISTALMKAGFRKLVWILSIGIWDLFEIWNLSIGIF